jgi:hypothetical protein
MGTGIVAIINPMLDALGDGWAYTPRRPPRTSLSLTPRRDPVGARVKRAAAAKSKKGRRNFKATNELSSTKNTYLGASIYICVCYMHTTNDYQTSLNKKYITTT